MNRSCPRRLTDLSIQSLLQKENHAIAALDWLPVELWPPLFMGALAGRHCKTLKAMVQAWPFTRLPLGALIWDKQPPFNVFKAVLDGLNDLLAQQHHHPQCKLQVLDLHTSSSTNFWRLHCEPGQDSVCSTEEPDDSHPMIKRRKVDGSRPGDGPTWSHMEVHIDLYLYHSSLDKFLSLLLRRVSLSNGALKLCCRNLEFLAGPPRTKMLKKLLQNLQLEWVQLLALESNWNLATLATLAPHLASMVHLRILCLRSVSLKASTDSTPDEADEVDQFLLRQLSDQFISLQHLQELQLDSVCYLSGRVHHLFQHLQKHLETLTIRHCWLLDSDLEYLSNCSSTRHLRCLSLTELTLGNLNPGFLNNLLDTASATLQTLDLSGCDLTDSQLAALTPALGHCSKLLLFHFAGNSPSLAVLGNLLRHVLVHGHLRRLELPVPLHCYKEDQSSLDQASLEAYLKQVRLILEESGRWPADVKCEQDPEAEYDCVLLKLKN